MKKFKNIKNFTKILVVLPVLLGLLLAGCTVEAPDSQTLQAPEGQEIFAKYVALGNSLTAGFMDGGLAMPGQLGSYPNLIARQIGATEFTQPYVHLPGVGSSEHPDNPMLIAGVLHFDGTGPSVLDWTTPSAGQDPTGGLLLALAQPTPYHNLGVPGATLHDVMNAYDSDSAERPGNSFFDFINRASFFDNVSVPATADPPVPGYETASMFGAGVALGPNLVTLWIGNNDILGSATNGTDLAITPTAQFQAEYTALLGTLAGGLQQRTGWPATIVVANIPSITSIPYFVPRAALEGQYGAWPWGYAETDVELVTFPLLSWLQDTDNQGTPIPGNYTLTGAEISAIETAVVTFNTIIDQVVAGVNAAGVASCAVVDANALMAGLPAAQRTHFMFLVGDLGVEGAAATTMFSLDGIHPNNVGYGVVANAFIEKINDLAGTNVPDVDVSGLSWDPTYGAYQAVEPARGGQILSAEAARAMTAVWQ